MATKFGPDKKPAVASKFLPFITDKATPLSIFKALVQRSKGLSNQELYILFSAILCIGINKIKEKVKTFPENYSTNHIIKTLLTKNQQFAPSRNTLRFWEYVIKNFGFDNIKTNADYTNAEIVVLFSSLAKHKEEFLKELGFDLKMEFFKNFSEEGYKTQIKNLNVDFTNKKNKVSFVNLEEFIAYVAYQLTTSSDTVSFYPVAVKYNNELDSIQENNDDTSS